MSRTTATIARNRQLLAAAVAFALVSVFVLQTSCLHRNRRQHRQRVLDRNDLADDGSLSTDVR